MYWLDLLDILFLVKFLQDKNDTINIFKFISSVECYTRAGNAKMVKAQLLPYVNLLTFLLQSSGFDVEFVTCDRLEPKFQFCQMRCIGSFMESVPQIFDCSNHFKLSYLCPCSKCFASPRA